jgi:hypothetical protein
MIDIRGLRWIGIACGGFTVMIALVALLVVSSHVSGQLNLENGPTEISSVTR